MFSKLGNLIPNIVFLLQETHSFPRERSFTYLRHIFILIEIQNLVKASAFLKKQGISDLKEFF